MFYQNKIHMVCIFRIVDFHNVTGVSKSYVGSCAYTPTLPFFRSLMPRPTNSSVPTKTPPPSPPVVSHASLIGPSPSVITIETTIPAAVSDQSFPNGFLTLASRDARFFVGELIENVHLVDAYNRPLNHMLV